MARFYYEGRDQKQKRTGHLTAENEREALIALKAKGIRVIALREQRESLLNKELQIGSPIKRGPFIMFLRQFSTLLRAGVTIVDTVRILSLQVDSKSFQKILREVGDELRSGTPLSTAFTKHPKAFPKLVVNMVKAGELSGSLDDTFEQLADHYEKSYRLRQKVLAALSYPIIVGIVALVVIFFLLTFIVPMFVEMFESMGSELPWLTQVVLQLSHFATTYWYLVAMLLLVIGVGVLLIRSNVKTRILFDTFLLRLPIFGDVVKKANLATMTRTLSSLFSSSVPILPALKMTEGVIENTVIANVLKESYKSLERGESLTVPMENHWAFPPLIPHMIAIGEQTGALDEMLAKVADFYEKEVEATTEKLKGLIEPLMIIFLAFAVGTIVLSILLPMFTLFTEVDNM